MPHPRPAALLADRRGVGVAGYHCSGPLPCDGCEARVFAGARAAGWAIGAVAGGPDGAALPVLAPCLTVNTLAEARERARVHVAASWDAQHGGSEIGRGTLDPDRGFVQDAPTPNPYAATA